jgi:hypothetical protein
MAESLINKVERAAKIATARHGVDVRAVVIDARPKDSASKLKSPKEARDELHRAVLPDPPITSCEPTERWARERVMTALPPR